MRMSILIAAALALLGTQSIAHGQILKKLEQRLGNVVERLNEAQAENAAREPTPAATPGYLGLTADETDGQKGVVVLATKPGSPAEAAGLKKDDLVTSINGEPIKNLEDFGAALDGIAAGQRAQFSIVRGREALTINATLVARQTPPVDRLGAEDPGPPPGGEGLPTPPAAAPLRGPAVVDDGRASLGVSVVALTDQARAATGVQTTRGAYVAAVKAGGPAERAGVPVGAVVVAIDGQRVNTPDELVGYIATARPGQEVELNYYRGTILTRKTVRLAPAALDARGTPAGSGISGIIGGGASDRPLVRKVEQVLDNLARPAGGVPAGQMEDVAALKSQVELLQATIRSLEDRLMKVEGKVGIGRPEAGGAEEGGARLPPAVDPLRRNELPLAPPDRPALPTPPPTP
jgi:PDZ domain-containing secreted protein